ncbi:MAG: type II toxin-antitoxin system HicA family toxin [Deltaproteobacteria bacterium]|jgi:predicted RNA binding protein YcfA (HicA-like mRNA interferase family)|nr:type II toxin-antitoxin system HicA family toxin [Deltaproteobacteria bacterium]MDL1960900.1 type II toxin-antitoxin system HicA family toxin [Deltaproteobacteria bacterium]
MTQFPSLKGEQIIRVLKKADFEVIRVKGSHHFLKHSDGRCTVVPVHSGETIGPGLFLKILRDCELTRDDFLKLQQKI